MELILLSLLSFLISSAVHELGDFYAYNFYKDNHDLERKEIEKEEMEKMKGLVPKQMVSMFKVD